MTSCRSWPSRTWDREPAALLPDTDCRLRAPDPRASTGFRPATFSFGKLRPYLAKSWRADRRGCCSTELIVMRPRPSVDGRWLAYLAQSRPPRRMGSLRSEGVKMPRTSWEKNRLLQVDAPTKAEQQPSRTTSTPRQPASTTWSRCDEPIGGHRDRLLRRSERRLLGYLGLRDACLNHRPSSSRDPATGGSQPLRHLDVEVQTGPFGSQLHAEEYVEGGTPIINPSIGRRGHRA